jgi:hypothetical protein
MVKVSSRFHAANPVAFFSPYIKGKIDEIFKETGESFLLQLPCVAYRYKRVSIQYIRVQRGDSGLAQLTQTSVHNVSCVLVRPAVPIVLNKGEQVPYLDVMTDKG